MSTHESPVAFRPERLPHTGNDHSTGPLVNCPGCVQEHYKAVIRTLLAEATEDALNSMFTSLGIAR